MVYYTFSQGFRPGGFNQNGNALHAYLPATATAPLVPQYIIPKSYSSDKLTNNEIGWKTEFLDHRLQWNGAIYRENWDNVQVAFFDPGCGRQHLLQHQRPGLPHQGHRDLVGRAARHRADAAGRGVLEPEPRRPIRPSSSTTTPIPTARTSASPSPSPATASAPIARRSPTRSARSALRAPMRRRFSSACAPVTSGASPATAPFAQVGATHSGHSFTQAGSNPTLAQAGAITTGRLRFENPAYTTYDASFGVAKDAWTVTVFGENLAQFERQHVREHRPVHRRADAAAAAGTRPVVRLQVLSPEEIGRAMGRGSAARPWRAWLGAIVSAYRPSNGPSLAGGT